MFNPSEQSPTPRTILIVGEGSQELTELREILQQSGYYVTLARDRVEALETLPHARPTLIISEVTMPGTDGYTLCQQVRSDARNEDILIILLTTPDSPGDIVRGLGCGADDLITRPFDAHEIPGRIHDLLVLKQARDSRLIPLLEGEPHAQSTSGRILNFFLMSYQTSVKRRQELTKARDELKVLSESLERTVAERTAALREEIAGRQRIEERLREQATLLDKARDAIIVCDMNNRIIYWNGGAETLYGWTSGEACGKTKDNLIYSANHPVPPEAAERLVAQNEWNGELNQIRKDGKQVVVHSSWTLLRDMEGSPRSIFTINTDITEKKKLEAQFLRAQRMEGIGTLASGIAHDLNNVLAPILLATAVLGEKFPDERARSFLGIVESSARRAADLVKQVLAFARGVDGERVPLHTRFVLQDIERVVVQSFPKSIRFTLDVPRDLHAIVGDMTQVHQVLLNLCVNARDAMPHGGSLTISAQNIMIDQSFAAMNPDAKPGPYVLIRVADSGAGMSQDLLDKIFEPFFTTKEIGKGTGLGLSTALAIVRSHEGFIQVHSEPGKGAEFLVSFPAAMSDSTAAEGAVKPLLTEGSGELILVVDDEEIIRDITQMTLEEHGYRVVTAGDGTDALAVFVKSTERISLVLMDVIMPFLDGPATIRALRKIDPDVKIVAVTGLSEVERTKRTASLEGTPCLQKPYTTEMLLRKLHEVLAGEPVIPA